MVFPPSEGLDVSTVAVLAVAIAALVRVVEYLIVKKRNGAGMLSPEYWREVIRGIVTEVMEQEFKIRNEKIRSIVQEELERFWRSK
jgi:hypothetical protein